MGHRQAALAVLRGPFLPTPDSGAPLGGACTAEGGLGSSWEGQTPGLAAGKGQVSAGGGTQVTGASAGRGARLSLCLSALPASCPGLPQGPPTGWARQGGAHLPHRLETGRPYLVGHVSQLLGSLESLHPSEPLGAARLCPSLGSAGRWVGARGVPASSSHRAGLGQRAGPRGWGAGLTLSLRSTICTSCGAQGSGISLRGLWFSYK